MSALEFTFEAPLWRWQADSAWHFVSLPEEVTDEIEDAAIDRRGFGSVRVEVTVGTTTWRTSIFPDTKRGTFVLPVKRQVRDREHLAEGDTVDLTVSVLD